MSRTTRIPFRAFIQWLAIAASLILQTQPVLKAQLPLLGGGCRKLPAIDPAKDFLGNFNNSCYALPLGTSRGDYKGGDLNAIYSLVYYQVTPGYQLILTGTYPNARFYSVTVYDEHAAITSDTFDTQILPLNASMVNPFLSPPYQPNQQYGITVGFGGGAPVTVDPGCGTSDTTIGQNVLDASQIHQGLTWTGYPDLPQGFPAHQTGANSGGALMVRDYDTISQENPPVVMVRQLSNGCAVPLSDASNIITTGSSGGKWQNADQVKAHDEFAYSIKPVECFPPDPQNHVSWARSSDYIPGINGGASYLFFGLTPSKVKSLISGGQFIRMQFQLPTMPNTPCKGGGCALTGLEQLRYRSISFDDNKATTYASIKDADMVQDKNGNVTLIIGMGAKAPASVTAQNGYTYFDLSQVRGYSNVANVAMRDILPNATFECSAFNVPFYTTEFNPEGGYMGNYVPTVDFPTASEIPVTPVPVTRPNNCTAVVTQKPVACGSEGQY